MREHSGDQAAGLQALELHRVSRVLPVVATSASADSLELLWRLEGGFRALDLPVTVVEGLQGLSPGDVRWGCRGVLRRWLADVELGTVVLLHAPLEGLAVLLADSDAHPLVALGSSPASVVQAYNAVKVLWQVAALEAVVLPIPDPGTRPDEAAQGRAQAGQDALLNLCAQRLEMVPALWPLGYHADGIRSPVGGDESCLLKVLDTALMLEERENETYADTHRRHIPHPADQIIGVSDVYRQRHA